MVLKKRLNQMKRVVIVFHCLLLESSSVSLFAREVFVSAAEMLHCNSSNVATILDFRLQCDRRRSIDRCYDFRY